MDNRYGVPLLDQIHNYFPDLLYNNRRFTTVQSLMDYINNQMSHHFNTYNRMYNEYWSRYTPAQLVNTGTTIIDQLFNYTEHPRNAHQQPVYVRSDPLPRVSTYMDDNILLNMLNNVSNSLARPITPPRTVQPATSPPPIPVRLGARSFLADELNNLFPELAQLIPGSNLFMRAQPISRYTVESDGIPQNRIGELTRISTTPASDASCPICYNGYSGEDICIINVCNHGFHRNCIQRWFENHHTCPMCRHDLLNTQSENVDADDDDDDGINADDEFEDGYDSST
jgi:hypothetical protein